MSLLKMFDSKWKPVPLEEWTLERGEPEIEVSPEAVEELTKILSNPIQESYPDYTDYRDMFLDYRDDPNVKLGAEFFCRQIDRLVLDQLKEILFQITQ